MLQILPHREKPARRRRSQRRTKPARRRRSQRRTSAVEAHRPTPQTRRAAAVDQRAPASRFQLGGVLTAHATVAVESRGATDTYGQLFDAGGRRLATDDDSGSGTNFRIAEELCPGRYVIRVEGTAGAEGPYVLAATAK